ncbi:MAG TPA: PAS domain S-box protein [Deltaproteobacteria bacterium]|nr:PAS domain S-box protein [Deltaproteobacteria bacterium]
MPRRRPSPNPRVKAQRGLFERFVETAGQAMGMADLEGRIFYANAALCRMLGEERSIDVYQKDIFAYYDPKTAERLRQEILPLVEREGQWVGELLLISCQGYATPTIENIYVLRDDSGKPLCITNVITDISQNKRMEQEICAYRAHLEDLVSERTADLKMSNALLHKEIAERKQVEETLKISEERFRRLTENAKDMIFRMSLPDGAMSMSARQRWRSRGMNPPISIRTPC